MKNVDELILKYYKVKASCGSLLEGRYEDFCIVYNLENNLTCEQRKNYNDFIGRSVLSYLFHIPIDKRLNGLIKLAELQ